MVIFVDVTVVYITKNIVQRFAATGSVSEWLLAVLTTDEI